MSTYQLIHDYKNNQLLKESFNELAKLVFNLDFSKWYNNGYWGDSYVCYSYMDGDKIIANASVNFMTVLLNGKEYNGIQIGTVMTHPDYRHQGLSKKLMDHILKEYEDKCDFLYLFANETVLDFYPKFGFTRIQETRYFIDADSLEGDSNRPVRQLNTENDNDVSLMKLYAKERVPVSFVVAVKGNENLLMFYFLIAFPDAIYFLEEQEVIVLFEEEEGELHLFDVISRKQIDLDKVLKNIVSPNTKKIIFYFIPDYEGVESELIEEEDDVLFVRPMIEFGTKQPLFPLTSHA
ncbi:GNAT family N-acetyltransferase [Lysinibacillus sp. NPDC097231]|uniref:GNAT family N-acetyltransferase n=1 Tax=Lysinibacillus sp. NPDC097231 TaxID=3364142 RepID=UPI0037F8B889